jgi:hypothetical protein
MINMEQFIRPSGNAYHPMRGVRNIMPYTLAPDQLTGPLPFTVPAAGAGTLYVKYTGINNFQTVWGTPLELLRMVYAGGTIAAPAGVQDISVRLRSFAGRDYMNAPVHIRTLYGWTSAVGYLPAAIREPFFLFTSEYIMAEFTKNSGGALTNFYPYMRGVQYYPITGPNAAPGDAQIVEKIKRWRDRSRNCYPFWLTTDNPIVHPAVGPGLTNTQQSQIKIADCPYEAFTIACVASTPNFELVIKEVVTGQTLMNGSITQVNGLGNGTLPTILPFSYVLPKGAILRITTKQLDGLGNTIYFTFQGRKINAPMQSFQVNIATPEDDIMTDADYERNIVMEEIGAI